MCWYFVVLSGFVFGWVVGGYLVFRGRGLVLGCGIERSVVLGV